MPDDIFAQLEPDLRLLTLPHGVVCYAILNRATLEDCACECYDAVKHENLALKIGIKISPQ